MFVCVSFRLFHVFTQDGNGNLTVNSQNSGNAITSNTAGVYPLTGNNTTAGSNVFTLLQIAGTNKVAYGWQNGRGIGIYDQVNNNWWLSQGTGTSGYVTTLNNTLDDGNGNVIVNSTPAANAFNFNVVGHGSQTFFGLTNYTSIVLSNANVSSSFGNNALLGITWDSTNGCRIFDLYNNHTWLTQGGTTAGCVKTANNTLDVRLFLFAFCFVCFFMLFSV